MIDNSLVYYSYPVDRINTQVIYRIVSAQVGCTGHILLNNCKHNITSLSLLVGTTVTIRPIFSNSLDAFIQYYLSIYIVMYMTVCLVQEKLLYLTSLNVSYHKTCFIRYGYF